MTLAGSDYLLRLSALAVSFVGFSAVIVALRRALGAELSDLHMHFVRLFIEGGFAVAALGLLPAALSFTGLGDLAIWRLSSATAALSLTVYFIFLFRRTRRITAGRVPFGSRILYLISALATLALWLNAVGILFPSSTSVYALALTWFLVLGGWVFLQNLELFLGQPAAH